MVLWVCNVECVVSRVVLFVVVLVVLILCGLSDMVVL